MAQKLQNILNEQTVGGNSKYGFKSTEFMSASEKDRVFDGWKKFVDSGFKRHFFTKIIYEHLHLNFGFIAHYDINGFYATYFEEPDDTTGFIQHIIEDAPTYKFEDYGDINGKMGEYLQSKLSGFQERLGKEQKELDVSRAKALLAKHGLKYGE